MAIPHCALMGIPLPRRDRRMSYVVGEGVAMPMESIMEVKRSPLQYPLTRIGAEIATLPIHKTELNSFLRLDIFKYRKRQAD